MAVTEESRHQLYQRLEELLGHDEATTLMEHLPPVGWADVATTRDLSVTEAAVRADLREEIGGLRVELREEIAGLRVELHRELRVQLLAMLAANATLAAIAFGAARLV